jgi:hypothetical protein
MTGEAAGFLTEPGGCASRPTLARQLRTYQDPRTGAVLARGSETLGGARGGGGSNYTGSYSGTASVNLG